MDKRARGLCFTCNDKWSYNHICKNRRELSAMLLNEEEGGEPENEETKLIEFRGRVGKPKNNENERRDSRTGSDCNDGFWSHKQFHIPNQSYSPQCTIFKHGEVWSYFG